MFNWYTDGGPYQINPTGPPRSTAPTPAKVFRGGSANHYYHIGRSARRTSLAHNAMVNLCGFRIARETDQL